MRVSILWQPRNTSTQHSGSNRSRGSGNDVFILSIIAAVSKHRHSRCLSPEFRFQKRLWKSGTFRSPATPARPVTQNQPGDRGPRHFPSQRQHRDSSTGTHSHSCPIPTNKTKSDKHPARGPQTQHTASHSPDSTQHRAAAQSPISRSPSPNRPSPYPPRPRSIPRSPGFGWSFPAPPVSAPQYFFHMHREG